MIFSDHAGQDDTVPAVGDGLAEPSHLCVRQWSLHYSERSRNVEWRIENAYWWFSVYSPFWGGGAFDQVSLRFLRMILLLPM